MFQFCFDYRLSGDEKSKMKMGQNTNNKNSSNGWLADYIEKWVLIRKCRNFSGICFWHSSLGVSSRSNPPQHGLFSPVLAVYDLQAPLKTTMFMLWLLTSNPVLLVLMSHCLGRDWDPDAVYAIGDNNTLAFYFKTPGQGIRSLR